MSRDLDIEARHKELTQLMLSYFGKDRIFFTIAMPHFDEDGEQLSGLEVSGNFLDRVKSNEDILKIMEFAYAMIHNGEETHSIKFEYEKVQ